MDATEIRPFPDKRNARLNFWSDCSDKASPVMGLVKVYRGVAPNFAKLFRPYDGLLCKQQQSNEFFTWHRPADQAYRNIKYDIADATLLSHLVCDNNTNASICITTDASNTALGSLLHQWLGGTWQPLAVFLNKLNPCQAQYSVFGHKHVAIYFVVHHIRIPQSAGF